MKKIGQLVFAMVLFISSCKKETTIDINSLSSTILNDISSNVVAASFVDLKEKAIVYNNSIATLVANPTASNLQTAKENWKNMRAVWEQCEGFLWGPVATSNFDPQTDTWPVNWVDLNTIINSTTPLTATYVSGLDDALKGYHPMEYLLWGKDGNKTINDFTNREFEYLSALSQNTLNTIHDLANSYDLTNPSSYLYNMKNFGSNSVYSTKREAYEELVNGIIGICDEVANGKINDPFLAQDPSLEESPFSQNSTTDFINNIQSVENIYYGKYLTDGKGINDFVAETNSLLDNKIKQKIATAKAALTAISLPFGQAILVQHNQVQNAQTAINDLKEILDTELLPLIQLHIK